MKKIIILIIITLSSCSPILETDQNYNVSGSQLNVVHVDSCEYITFGLHGIIHKANCKNHVK